MNLPLNKHADLTFLSIKGFGRNVLVQLSFDKKFFVISTFYQLTPLLALEDLVEKDVGNIFDFSKRNQSLLIALIRRIEFKSQESERINTKDSLLLARAFYHIEKSTCTTPYTSEFDNDILDEAINISILEDDYLKDYHFKLVQLLKKSD